MHIYTSMYSYEVKKACCDIIPCLGAWDWTKEHAK